MARATLLAAAAACALGGCGTVTNLGPGECGAPSPRKVYGGVGADLECLGGLLGSLLPENSEDGCWHLMKVTWPVRADVARDLPGAIWLVAVDIPLCVVLDTLTLPVTIPATASSPPTAAR